MIIVVITSARMVSVMTSIATYLFLHTLYAVPCWVQLTKPSCWLLAATNICYNGKCSDGLCSISASQLNCVYQYYYFIGTLTFAIK